MRRWRVLAPPEAAGPDFQSQLLVERLLAVRGLAGEAREHFLAPQYERDLADPFLFRDMRRTVERIGSALRAHEPIGIFGDFDADGVTATVILHEALLALGAKVVTYFPHKVNEGHGLNAKAVRFFAEHGVRLFLTLDCGMMNHAEIALAREQGMDVIIIDHHHVPPVLPAAYTIINPKLPGETYPFRELCGAGTSFKVASALYATFLPAETEQLKWLLDVAAIGTVADVMPLIGENRTIVKYGLLVLQKTRRVGLQEMAAVGRIPMTGRDVPVARTIAFHIAPRINAASRMAHAETAHALLMVRDRAKARALALDLEAYNVARQKVSQETAGLVRTLAEGRFHDKPFIFAVSEHYPLGVIGLVAGKIAGEFGKPVCILQRGEQTSTGSFRSIPGLSIVALLEQCSDLVVKFGGHEQAAGMTIANEHLGIFETRFTALVAESLQHEVPEPEITIDLEVRPDELSLETVRALGGLAPFGEGNRVPVFALRGMTVEAARTVGKDGQHWKLTLKNGGAPHVFDAVGWSMATELPDIARGDMLDIAFELEENSWNGSRTVQLKLVDIKQCSL